MSEKTYRFATRAIHSHQAPDKETGAVIVPIYQTSTFEQDDAGQHRGYEYSRTGNPTRTALEGCLADLEGAAFGYCFSSGLGALITLCNAFFKPGDHLLCTEDVYGGTFRYLDKVLRSYGVETDFIDFTNPTIMKQHVKPNTKAIFIETPTNPTLKLVDIAALVAIAKEAGAMTVLDNTFASPYCQQGLALGVDIILHSTTKYIGGHSDVVGGALITNNDAYSTAIRYHQNSMGATPGPFDSWLTLRGLKTLAIRMKQHEANALALAQFLEQHPSVEKVIYPGLPSHPQHELAKRQMMGFGGMIAVYVKGGLDGSRRFMKALKLFTLAESLGGVESLVEHPALMTHLSVDPAVREAAGIADNLVRMSVGIEDTQDLIEDVTQALKAIEQAAV